MSADGSNVIIPANYTLFGDLCEVFKQLYKRKKQRAEQDKILAKFIDDFRVKVANTDGKKVYKKYKFYSYVFIII